MSGMEMMIGSIAMSALGASQQNKALQKQQQARNATAARQVAEMKRQKARQDLIAQEEKSDRARELDKQIGSLYAAGADGGVTQGALMRASGATGAVAGVDTARIESNRQETTNRLRSETISILENNSAQQAQTSQTINGNTMKFFANAAGSAFDFAFNSTDPKKTALGGTGNFSLPGLGLT